MPTDHDDQRDPSGRFRRGNRAAAKSSAPWDRKGLTDAERRWRANLRKRLEEAGRGTRKWCERRAGQALVARRFVEACGSLQGAELRAEYDRLRAASDLLLRIEEEATKRPSWRDPHFEVREDPLADV